MFLCLTASGAAGLVMSMTLLLQLVECMAAPMWGECLVDRHEGLRRGHRGRSRERAVMHQMSSPWQEGVYIMQTCESFAIGMVRVCEMHRSVKSASDVTIAVPVLQFDLVTGRQISQDLQGKFCVSAPEQRMHPVYDPHSTNDGWWW